MIRLIYNLLWPLGLLLFLPSYLAKMFRRGGYREDFGQRLGFYSNACRQRLHGKSPTWIHAVSVGEVLIALKLAEQLRTLRPDLKCVLTPRQQPAMLWRKSLRPIGRKFSTRRLIFGQSCVGRFALLRRNESF
jgi:3-deoxy-D-manno-octulosonic-acid transferase